MSETKRSLLDSTRNLVDTGLGLLQTRIELLAVEVEEEKARLLSMLTLGAVAFASLGLGLVFFAITLTVLLWDDHRLMVLVLLSATFLMSGGLALFFLLRRKEAPRERIFAASIAELDKDRAAARGATRHD